MFIYNVTFIFDVIQEKRNRAAKSVCIQKVFDTPVEEKYHCELWDWHTQQNKMFG